MRTTMRVGGVVALLVFSACNGGNESADEGLLKDLELASVATPISLQKPGNAAEVVSPIELTSPVTRRIASSRRVPRYKPVPRAVEAPVESAADEEQTEESTPEPVFDTGTPVEVASLPSPRPQPVYSPGVGGHGDGQGSDPGHGIGVVIGVVLRGGHAGIDDCDPRTDGRRRRGGMAVNNRIPVVGTFPAGTIQGTFPGSGRITASLPGSRRSRF